MKNYQYIKRVCAVDTVHGLLHYLLLSSYEEISSTFFFFGCGIDDKFKSKFGSQYATILPDSHGFVRKLLASIPILRNVVDKVQYFFRHCIYFPLKWPFLLNSKLSFWGMCHHNFSPHVLRNHEYFHVEDGMLNYIQYPYNPPKSRLKCIWQYILGKDYCTQRTFSGSEERCKKVFLTGMMVINDENLKRKAVIHTLQELWDSKDRRTKDFINEVFDIKQEDIHLLCKYDSLLLLQPFAIDGWLDESEEIDMYKWIIDHIQSDRLLIKPHPRDKRDFSQIYGNQVPVFSSKAPMELLALNQVVFTNVYTVSSSAALALPYPFNLFFIGNRVSKTLYERNSQCTQENFKTDNPNVTVKTFPNRF